ncbi:hypothetical protein [Pontibacillus halophilus]|uniref:hypothetical protein n=1 Tax=Pontibacillus halophilus TaxID=516704 RepID=UPI0003F6D816|nr:hypothetical protein [Pontibacillus halophilus]
MELKGGEHMSKEVRLRDILTPEEKNKIAKLKKKMYAAPNKREVEGISQEIYAIYEQAKKRYFQFEERTDKELSATVSMA